MKVREERKDTREALLLAKLYVKRFAKDASKVERMLFTRIRTYILETRKSDLGHDSKMDDGWFCDLHRDINQNQPKISV